VTETWLLTVENDNIIIVAFVNSKFNLGNKPTLKTFAAAEMSQWGDR